MNLNKLSNVLALSMFVAGFIPLFGMDKDSENDCFFKAVKSEKIDEVADFPQNGVDVNVRDVAGCTSLIWAVEYGSSKLVQLLLDNGADVNVKDMVGLTPLMLASNEGREQVVELLLSSGAEPRMGDLFGKTAVEYARENGQVSIMSLLKERVVNLNDHDAKHLYLFEKMF